MELSKEKILIQLNKIIESRLFHESYKLKRFLTYVVTETLENRFDLLKQYNIAIHAFDRDEDFDSDSDPIVRIQAGRLRTSLTVYYSTEGQDDPILITIPTGTYKPTIIENVVPQKVEIIYQDSVIAIEAFKNLSGDLDKQYMADGFKEELLFELTNYDHLSVIRLSNENQSEIGKRFARFILRGSIRFTTSRIKLVIHLEDRKTNESIWVQDYELPFDPKELIDSQEAIARTVANRVGDVIGGVIFIRLIKEAKNKPIQNIIAYDALLKFYSYNILPVEERLEECLRVTKQVLKEDNENGYCWAILSALTIDGVALNFTSSKTLDFNNALAFALKGVEFEPDMQITRTYLGYAYLMTNSYDRAIEEANKALEINSKSAFYLGALGWLIALSGEWKRGLDLMEEGIYLNPGYPTWYHLASCTYYLGTNNFERALVEANKFDVPELFWDPLLKGVSHAYLGNMVEAKKYADKLLEVSPNFSEHGEVLMRMYIKDENHFAMYAKGLEIIKIGLKVRAEQ